MKSHQFKSKFQQEMTSRLIILTILISSSHAATDYCLLCTNHIACNNAGNFAAICPPDAALIALSVDVKNSIVAAHNDLRNKVASGNQPGLSSAVKMNKMVSFHW